MIRMNDSGVKASAHSFDLYRFINHDFVYYYLFLKQLLSRIIAMLDFIYSGSVQLRGTWSKQKLQNENILATFETHELEISPD